MAGDVETLVHLLKGFFGTGILAMPQGFMYVGLINGLVSTMFIGFMCIYSIHILVQAEYQICKRYKVGLLDYHAAMRYAVEIGPVKTRRYSKAMAYTVDVFMVLVQAGTGCIYMVFVAQNVYWFAKDYPRVLHISPTLWLTALLPGFAISVLLPDLKYLTPVSFVGNAITLVSFGLVCFYVFRDLPPVLQRRLYVFDNGFALYFGTMLFSLQAIGVTVTAENCMKHPEHFLGLCGVLNIGMITAVVIYMIIGFCGYWRYGPQTLDSITLNLPFWEIPAKISTMCYTVAIFLSYCLQIFVSNHILWNNYLVKLFSSRSQVRITVYEYIFRLIVLVLTYGIAVGVPYLGLIISLVGCLCETALGFVFPAMIDLCHRWPDDMGRCRWILYRGIFFILFGLTGFTVGTYCSVREIVIVTMKNSH